MWIALGFFNFGSWVKKSIHRERGVGAHRGNTLQLPHTPRNHRTWPQPTTNHMRPVCGNNFSENRHIYTPRTHCTWPQPTTIWDQYVEINNTQPPTTVLDLIEPIVGSLNHQPYETSVDMIFQRSNILNTYTNSSIHTWPLDHRAHVTMHCNRFMDTLLEKA